ncbi:MAG: lamin tail domain-containing protein [Ruminococcus sp.]|nr:lamin tail domain-containing protein [Ruminococcus sp.]
MKKKRMQIFSACMAAAMLLSPLQQVEAADAENTIFINEIESNDPVTDTDWVEIINAGTTDKDISGWFITDDKGLERLVDGAEWRIADGTVLKAGEVLVIEHSDILDNLSLGKNDTVSLYDSNSNIIDTYTYTGHAAGTYSRVPDGTGEFVDQAVTKAALNIVEEEVLPEYKIVINEVNSSPDDWVEIMNLGTGEMDLSGYEIRDNSDDHRWKFPEGTKVASGELFVVDAKMNGLVYNDQTGSYEEGVFEAAIGIGSGDSIRIFDREGILVDECSWTEHASYNGDAALASIGRYPDGTGAFVLMKETKGLANDWYKPQVVVNEVESDSEETVSDWAEIYNAGTTDVDISGWYLYDDDPVSHAADITPVAEGTILAPGEFYTFEINKDFTFGLGKNDKVVVYNKDGVVIDEFSWNGHAEGVYARIPDGTGEFVDFETATKGKANIVTNPVVINEVQSNDKNDGPDWIELANPTADELDVSGVVIKDNDDTHQYVIPEGTTIPANGFLVITEDDFGFGLGKNDSVRLYENEMLIGSTTWAEHTNPTWGLYPDVKGTEYRNTKEETPGAANKFEGIPDVIAWPGDENVEIFDKEPTFLEDSSGLDFFNGQLYAVDNGTGKFWILDVAEDGSLSFAEGFENGKRVRFQKDENNAAAAGPDSEGITVDGNGLVYLASERDNSVKGVNYNSILMVDPSAEGEDLTALMEWDLTASLPQVSANMGIESVEWVSNTNVNGKLFDQNTNAAFDASNYPDAVADGIFFVALEDNGHVYAYVLNEDGSSVQIADIDAKIGGAMALDYDTYENVLWVVADNGFDNRAAKVFLTGDKEAEIVHVTAANGVDITANNEGFAIADAVYTVDGQRPVYRFKDGETSGALSIGSLACDYADDSTGDGDNASDADGDGTGDSNNDGTGDINNGNTDMDGDTPVKDNTGSSDNASSDNTNGKNNVKDSNTNDSAAPKTGDDSRTLIWMITALGSAITVIAVNKRKNA